MPVPKSMCRQHLGATMTPRDAQLEELRLPPGRVVRTLYAPGSKIFLVEIILRERPLSRICIRQPTSKQYKQLGSPDEHTHISARSHRPAGAVFTS
jgi:hypothetical protein